MTQAEEAIKKINKIFYDAHRACRESDAGKVRQLIDIIDFEIEEIRLALPIWKAGTKISTWEGQIQKVRQKLQEAHEVL